MGSEGAILALNLTVLECTDSAEKPAAKAECIGGFLATAKRDWLASRWTPSAHGRFARPG